MAKKVTAPKAKERKGNVLDSIIATSKARGRKNIAQWRTALQAAENVDRPNRILLYNLYRELVLDAEFLKESGNRRDDLKSCKFQLVSATGEVDDEKTKLLKRPWFYKLMDVYTDTWHWGHSLLEINNLIDGEVDKVELIDRWHVIPEKGLFVKRQGDENGLMYRDEENTYNWLIEIGENDDLGLLNACAPHILYARFAQSAWSEYCELFAMPLRIGKTNVKDTESLRRMEQMLVNMATGAYGIIGDEEEIEFVQATVGDGAVYENLMRICTAKIAKIISGAVKGEDSKNGSRSKEEVSERTTNKKSGADKEAFEAFVTFTLIPKLVKLGYPLDGYEFEFEEAKDLDQLFKFASGLLTHYDVDEDYIENTFGIPVTKKATPTAGNLNADPDFFS